MRRDLMQRLGLEAYGAGTHALAVTSPRDGTVLGSVPATSDDTFAQAADRASKAFLTWRAVPAPQRGELVREFGNVLRSHKDDLATLVTLECGKIKSEGLGEVQEMIDICDFAVGLSRQLYGLTIASERPGHHMREVWHPLGPVGIISAFNFPVAVWAWNAALALVCGNPCVWKPSEKTPLTALAVQYLFDQACAVVEDIPPHLSQIVLGDARLGEQMVDHPQMALISATGSCAMGRRVGPRVAARFGRSLLELGGNNAAIVTPSADIDLAVRAICFSAAGTAGQRCTSLRRLFLHRDVYDQVLSALKNAYESLPVGDPLAPGTLVGPLIDEVAVAAMEARLAAAREEGGTVFGGGPVTSSDACVEGGFYRRPALIEMPVQSPSVQSETFAPILYVMAYDELEEAIALQNDVPQGLSSCIFTLNVREAEYFLSAVGSDCGIANVNIGPSGAEIGGAFGGEKETGGGRESGSDAWKAYMRRQTQTINYSDDLPLAQGVKFDL
ncbi:MAG: aldehyde dehydrogenase family protein [Pseudomonadota bacterium]